MKKITPLLVFILLPFLLTAQSVLITPGAQSINGDSTIQNQLNAFGNGLLVGPKVKFTDEDPASNVHIMDCGTTTSNTSIAGTLKDPSGDSDYLSGFAHDCFFYLNNAAPFFVAYQIDFEVLDTEAAEDTVFIMYGSKVLASYSGNTLPPSIIVSNSYVTIRFKTNSTVVGAGFVLTWKAILRDETPSAIQNYTGQGLVYDVESNSLWAGKHNPLYFENSGIYSLATGYNSNASGRYSTAMGHSTTASGSYSTAIGLDAEASGNPSMAMGSSSIASGGFSTAIGSIVNAIGSYSIAMGTGTEAVGSYSMAMGFETRAVSTYATAMGNSTLASGYSSTAMGEDTEASGDYSTAMGRSTVADTSYATAMGKSTLANGYSSTAMGEDTEASGSNSTAMGQYTIASGTFSTAMGYDNNAIGNGSTAMGGSSTASGNYSTTIGLSNSAIGDYSIALGRSSTAGGNYSTAIGNDVASNGVGTFTVGDSNPGSGVLTIATDNQFVGRFYNGYYLLTSEMGSPSRGVRINHDQTAWSSISDSTKKENFIPADGDEFLQKLKGLKLGSWNYKSEEQNPERFYGPMAQEIYDAYGKDAKGTIGSDTLVSTLNMDGLLFIFAQELEKRTANLKGEISDLKKENEVFKSSNQELKQSVASLEKSFKTEILELKASLNSIQKDKAKASEMATLDRITSEIK